MPTFKITIDSSKLKSKLDATEKQIKEGVEQGLKICGSEIKVHEQRLIEQRTGHGEYLPTGNLKRSVTILPLEWSPYGASISVVPTASYALYANSGTGIFVSGGRQGGWAYTPDNGRNYYFTYGMPPKHFYEDTLDYYREKAPVIIEEQIYKCLK